MENNGNVNERKTNKNNNSEELRKNEQKFIDNLVKIGKAATIKASKDKKFDERIKRMSSY